MRKLKQSSESLARALEVVGEALAKIGLDRVEAVTLTRHRISVSPIDLADGEQIARLLGCTSPLDNRMLTPGFTNWSGDVAGFEVHVRARLRQPAGALA